MTVSGSGYNGGDTNVVVGVGKRTPTYERYNFPKDAFEALAEAIKIFYVR